MKGFLKHLSCCNKKSLPGIIKHACKKDFRRLISFTMEVMRKHVKVSPELARLIKQNRHALRHIVHPLYSLKSKKQYLIQHGGGKVSRVIRGIGRHLGISPQSASAIRGPPGMRMRSGFVTRGRPERVLDVAPDSVSFRESRPRSAELIPGVDRPPSAQRWGRAPGGYLEATSP